MRRCIGFGSPEPLPGQTISWVAGAGILINTITALLFFRGKETDLNIRSAFIHLLSDAIVSAGLVLGGIIIFYTRFYWLDAALSLFIAAMILWSTWRLLKDSLRLSLDGVPGDIDLHKVKQAVKSMNGVRDFHHIHVWGLSTTENALTGHIVVDKEMSMSEIDRIKREAKHTLEHLHIQHATLEIEMENTPCEGPDCD